MPAPAPKSIYQLKVTSNDSKPPIWRRILEIVMGWANSHLHQFLIDDEY